MRRSPLLVYLLVWVTLGFYAIWWFFTTMLFLNDCRIRRPYNVRLLGWSVGTVLSSYLIGFAIVMGYSFYTDFDVPDAIVILMGVLWVLALVWNFFVFFSVWHISTRIREAQATRNLENPILPAISMLSFVLWFTCFPYMQHHINRLIDEPDQKS